MRVAGGSGPVECQWRGPKVMAAGRSREDQGGAGRSREEQGGAGSEGRRWWAEPGAQAEGIPLTRRLISLIF